MSNGSPSTLETKSSFWFSRRSLATVIAVALIAFSAKFFLGSSSSSDDDGTRSDASLVSSAVPLNPTTPKDLSEKGTDSDSDDADARLTKMMTGKWKGSYQGTWTVTLNPDGSAVMIFEPNWIASLMYGSKLEMLGNWFIRDATLIHQATGGEPSGNVQKFLKDNGANRSFSIEHIDDHTVKLLSLRSGKTRLVWKRQ